MQCPRCGLQNSPDITACARCGLPVPGQAAGTSSGGSSPASSAPSGSAPQAPPGPPPPSAYPPPGSYGGSPGGSYGGSPGEAPGESPGSQPYGSGGQYGGAQYPGAQYPGAQYPGGQYPGGQYPGGGAPAGSGEAPYAPYGPVSTPYSPAGGSGSAPYGPNPSAAWPVTTSPQTGPSSRDGGRLATLLALGLGVLGCLVYAIWAFTARRGIFADFADGNSVSGDDARSSDRIDTILLLVAAVLVVVALALWVTRSAQRRTGSRGLDMAGLALAALGVLVALIGLYLASQIVDADGQSAQGDKGVTASLVTGGGFALLALGLLLGALAVRATRDSEHGSPGDYARASGYAPPW